MSQHMNRATWGYKLKLLFLYAAAYGFFYIWPNLYPLAKPAMLPLLAVDRAMPFLPWTFLIYLSDYALFIATFFLIVDLDEWNAFVRTAFGGLLFCGLCFLFFPTTYPRPIYPVVENPLVSFAMNLVGSADTPNNCFPSMHVAMTAVAVWNLRRKSKALLAAFVFWSLAIYVSTMTTKQHYFMDILGGLTVVAVVAVLDRVYLARVRMNQVPAPARRTP